MGKLRILVVEDASNWKDVLPTLLQGLGGEIQVDVALGYNPALKRIASEQYDLVSIDLRLPGDEKEPAGKEEFLGMELLRELRRSPRNQGSGLIVLTGYPTTGRMRQALKEYGADDFVDKDSFNGLHFLQVVRRAIWDARVRQAREKANARYRLIVSFSREHLIGSDVTGPDRRLSYTADHPVRFEVADLARRADNLNAIILRDGASVWRPEARSIGKAIYDVLANERHILGDMIAVRALAQRFSDLSIKFRGPPDGLGIPFELLRDKDDYLGLNHLLIRQVVHGSNFSRKPESFHSFLDDLVNSQRTLRVLVVGANSDGHIPAAEAEANTLAETIEADLQQIGILCEVTLLNGPDATYARVRAALRNGRYHIFHYAGHGRYDDVLPEVSGLILPDDGRIRTLTASDLNILVGDTELRLVFLSCCLGARTGAQVGRGDFYGVMEALSRADIPIVLGYRWTVADTPAMELARVFYEELWHTLSPGEALLQARRSSAMGTRGRDDETWASPVLLMQNA